MYPHTSCHRGRHESRSERHDHHDTHGHGYSGRSRRVFDHGDLRMVILRLLADRPSHGYELIKQIEDRLAGAYSPSPGLVYPTLSLLEELGHIAPTEGDGPRKAYAITDEGRAALERQRAEVEAVFGKIAEVAERAGAGVSPRVLRALEGVKLALRLRLQRGPLGESQITDAVAALEAAAQTIERA